MFTGFICLPPIISAPGVYITRAGEEVSISRVSTKPEFGCCGKYATGQVDSWHYSGRLYAGVLSDNDIVAAKM